MAALDRLLGVFERFVETPEAEFSVGAQIEPLAHRRVARTEQHGLLDIGFGLLKTAQIVLRVASQRQQPSGVRINRKPGVEGEHRIFGAARDRQVLALDVIGVDIAPVERDRSVDQAEDRCVIIGVHLRRIDILEESRLGFPHQRLAVVGIFSRRQ